jgi:hypothetical protein
MIGGKFGHEHVILDDEDVHGQELQQGIVSHESSDGSRRAARGVRAGRDRGVAAFYSALSGIVASIAQVIELPGNPPNLSMGET